MEEKCENKSGREGRKRMDGGRNESGNLWGMHRKHKAKGREGRRNNNKKEAEGRGQVKRGGRMVVERAQHFNGCWKEERRSLQRWGAGRVWVYEVEQVKMTRCLEGCCVARICKDGPELVPLHLDNPFSPTINCKSIQLISIFLTTPEIIPNPF